MRYMSENDRITRRINIQDSRDLEFINTMLYSTVQIYRVNKSNVTVKIKLKQTVDSDIKV